MKKFLIGLLILSLVINVLKIVTNYVINLIENHKLTIGEKCKYLGEDEMHCKNTIGKIIYNSNSKCIRNKCPCCTKEIKIETENILEDNKFICGLIKTSEITAQVTASILIIQEVLGE